VSESSAEFPTTLTEAKSLLGFFTEAEAVNVIKSQGIPLEERKEQALTEQIREAIKYVKSLSGRKIVSPEISDIVPEELGNRGVELQAEPTFQEHLARMSGWSFSWVELEKLHAFQPNINPEYVERLKQRAPAPGDVASLLKFCLPLRSEIPKSPAIGGFNPNANTFTLISENLDFRIVGQVNGEDPISGRSFFGFAYGSGLPQMSVVEYKGLFMIKNGYHRAYALLKRGHKSLPCLLVRTDNYSLTGAMGPGFFNIDIMMSDRSPLLSDFSSLAAVTYPRRLARVMLTVHAEAQIFPV
jgi:hypothetical protein